MFGIVHLATFSLAAKKLTVIALFVTDSLPHTSILRVIYLQTKTRHKTP